jgi:hypothetical protein
MSELTLNAVVDAASGQPTHRRCRCGSSQAGTGCRCESVVFNDQAEVRTFLAYNKRWSESARKQLLQTDPASFAGPDGTFPVVNQQDADSAARLVHHAADPEAVRKRLVEIAMRKNLTLPASWQPAGNAADPLDTARYASRRAARSTLKAAKMDRESGALSGSSEAASRHESVAESDATTNAASNRTARLAARALRKVQAGDMDAAMKLHQRAAVAHDARH